MAFRQLITYGLPLAALLLSVPVIFGNGSVGGPADEEGHHRSGAAPLGSIEGSRQAGSALHRRVEVGAQGGVGGGAGAAAVPPPPPNAEEFNVRRPQVTPSHPREIISATSGEFTTKVHYDASVCAGFIDIVKEGPGCAKGESVRFTTDRALGPWIQQSFGPDFYRIMLRGPEVIMANTTRRGVCLTRSHFFMSRPGSYLLTASVVFEEYRAVNEMVEKTWYDYSNLNLLQGVEAAQSLLECSTPFGKLTSAEAAAQPCGMQLAGGGGRLSTPSTQSLVWGRWVAAGPDTSDFKREFPNYWLPLKRHERKMNDHTPDLLGRMNYNTLYRWQPYGCTHVGFSRAEALEILRDTPLFFFGDSHLRMTFYGMLTRLGIRYSNDKVWKGDRSDTVASHNVTVAYVASYFLNMSRPTAVDMLRKDGIVLAGVGQHHASACFSLRKHAVTVEEAMEEFDRRNTSVIWFGVPAHPHNLHMRVVQRRTDCRNNLRHRLYNKVQGELARFRGYPIVDTFAKSWPMIHTSPDGAHYYTWVREAWLDDILMSVKLLKQSRSKR